MNEEGAELKEDLDEEEDANDETEEDEPKEEDDDGEAEEEAREEEAQAELEGEDAAEEEIDQKSINRTWIKALNANYPCFTYYKSLKKNILIILNSERIETRKYPKWS